jgi:hypothetical protein
MSPPTRRLEIYRLSVERMHRCSGSSVRSLQAYTGNVASIRIRTSRRLVALCTLGRVADEQDS